jgi:lantibiotic modifying enzyme
MPGQEIPDDDPFSYATAWCHGAPEIGLSRLRSYEITGDETIQYPSILLINAEKPF